MTDSTNPVSPKVITAGIGALVGPLLLTIGQALVDAVNNGAVQFPEPWQSIATVVVSIIGAVIGAYVQKDGLRLPTLEPSAVQALPNSEVKLAEAADKLNDPLP